MNTVRGYTLIEVIMIVVIVGILAAVGFPAMQSTFGRSDAETYTSEMSALLKYARAQAYTNNEIVTVCPMNEGETSCAGSVNDWKEKTVVVFFDRNNNGDIDTETERTKREDILKIIPALETKTEQDHFVPTTNANTLATRKRITFTRTGSLDSGNSVPRLTYCSGDTRGSSNYFHRQLTINIGGQTTSIVPNYNSDPMKELINVCGSNKPS